MAAELYVISGFLGAGKTTLIQKLLREAFRKDKVVLIENDFGEISVDAALLKSGGFEVKEMNSGCICCSLSGDFVKAVNEIRARFRPDKIIIEPSGVAKLTDIMKACTDPSIRPFVNVKTKITVVDVKRCEMYRYNFGEFFEDQIQNADVILLSRTEDFPDKVNEARRLMERLNPRALILAKPWDQISADKILLARPEHEEQGNHSPGCGCGHHGIQGHDSHCSCDHNHSAEEIFNTVTIKTEKVFSKEDLRERISYLEHNAKGRILRAKGILRGTNGYVNLQYLPGHLKILNCDARGNMLCIIGQNLNRQELVSLFSGE
ncbi:GTP-binding protein [Desulfosporosinus sp. PR]|uniref:CobW family GTP-binding protein n=1 Tax=Candidatus Desulfosporosinus nitrosoreducens TaxID=3401928 RepID=UPI0027F7CA56|nr:GTP-binding protein [Desulfosporosinus sp. PR]MDQ7093589.1 GTP-binding protein [Desulfosporosinus sp. PR]